MRGTFLLVTGAIMTLAAAGGPYKVLKTVKAGGEGGFDYVYADSDERKLYVARSGPTKRILFSTSIPLSLPERSRM